MIYLSVNRITNNFSKLEIVREKRKIQFICHSQKLIFQRIPARLMLSYYWLLQAQFNDFTKINKRNLHFEIKCEKSHRNKRKKNTNIIHQMSYQYDFIWINICKLEHLFNIQRIYFVDICVIIAFKTWDNKLMLSTQFYVGKWKISIIFLKKLEHLNCSINYKEMVIDKNRSIVITNAIFKMWIAGGPFCIEF